MLTVNTRYIDNDDSVLRHNLQLNRVTAGEGTVFSCREYHFEKGLTNVKSKNGIGRFWRAVMRLRCCLSEKELQVKSRPSFAFMENRTPVFAGLETTFCESNYLFFPTIWRAFTRRNIGIEMKFSRYQYDTTVFTRCLNRAAFSFKICVPVTCILQHDM